MSNNWRKVTKVFVYFRETVESGRGITGEVCKVVVQFLVHRFKFWKFYENVDEFGLKVVGDWF